jgi:hypothetical protein
MRGMLVYPAGLGQLGDPQMKNYSIIRVGNEYIVQAGENSVLKTTSRRRAARTVTVAAELLQSQPAAATPPDSDSDTDPSSVAIPLDCRERGRAPGHG